MVKLVFKRYKGERFLYTTDSVAKISKGKAEDIVVVEGADCNACTVYVCRKTVYRSPLCYLNILNPFLYLWRFKVSSVLDAEFSRALDAYKVKVYNADDNACLVLMIDDVQGKTTFNCIDGADSAEIRVKQGTVDKRTQRRFTVTNVANTLLWTVAVIVMMLLPDKASYAANMGKAAVVAISVAEAAYILSRIFKR